MVKRVWKAIPIEEYKSIYQVSSDGLVRSLERTVVYRTGKAQRYSQKILTPIKQSTGYYSVNLINSGKRKTCYIHTLVALAFLGARPEGKNGEHIRHRDNDTSNNNYRNLKYSSAKRNFKDQLKGDTHLYGEYHPAATLTSKQIGEIRTIKATKKINLTDLGEQYKVSRHSIRKIVEGKTWDPDKFIIMAEELEKNNKLKEAKRVRKEIQDISPKVWQKWLKDRRLER